MPERFRCLGQELGQVAVGSLGQGIPGCHVGLEPPDQQGLLPRDMWLEGVEYLHRRLRSEGRGDPQQGLQPLFVADHCGELFQEDVEKRLSSLGLGRCELGCQVKGGVEKLGVDPGVGPDRGEYFHELVRSRQPVTGAPQVTAGKRLGLERPPRLEHPNQIQGCRVANIGQGNGQDGGLEEESWPEFTAGPDPT